MTLPGPTLRSTGAPFICFIRPPSVSRFVFDAPDVDAALACIGMIDGRLVDLTRCNELADAIRHTHAAARCSIWSFPMTCHSRERQIIRKSERPKIPRRVDAWRGPAAGISPAHRLRR
jgi:hypothetical protein